jgi:hypothetical protein
MARTEKTPEPITKKALQSALVRLKGIVSTFENAAIALADDDRIAVNYGKSLERGLLALESFEPELRKSLVLFQAGIPVEFSDQVSSAIAESEAAIARAKAKAKPPIPQQSQGKKGKAN